MSDLQKSFAKAQLAKLPPEPIPVVTEEAEDGDENIGRSSADSSSSASSTGTIRPSASQNLFQRPSALRTKTRSGPLPWHEFLAQELFFDQQIGPTSIRHHVYLSPPSGNGPLFVTHHGAGSSGLSFALWASEVQKLVPNAGIVSPDARYHGETVVAGVADQTLDLDLSLPVLSQDLHFVIQSTLAYLEGINPRGPSPDIILVGHSLGGAVITHLACRRVVPALLGYVVLDVVEGSAMDALQHMDQYLSTRPQSFPSLASGIEWHIRSRTIRNATSARVSVPSLLREQAISSQPGLTTVDEVTPASDPSLETPTSRHAKSIYTWRTALVQTRPFWESWFTSLSSRFLSVPGAAKLLILAGTDRLDKELMIGQMQGKYQLSVIPEAGHFVHEDSPVKVAEVVAEFWRRNDRSGLVLPPKVDDLIRMGKIKGGAAGGVGTM